MIPADAGRLCGPPPPLCSTSGESMVTRFQDIPADILASPELQALLLQLPAGVIVAEAPSGQFLAVNAGAERIWQGALPKPESIADYSRLFPGYRPNGRPYGPEEWPLTRALQGEVVTGEEIEFRLGSGARRILQVSAAPARDDAGEIRVAIAIFHDITEQRQEERRRDFLMGLTDEMRVIEDPIAIMEIAASATGEELGVSSASYADIAAGSRAVLVQALYRNGRITPAGKYSLDEFGPNIVQQLVTGQTVAIDDVAADTRVTTTEIFERWEVRSAILVPLIRRGRITALFTAAHETPRPWTRSDLALVEHVGERSCHAIETARVEADLRQSREWLTLALEAG